MRFVRLSVEAFQAVGRAEIDFGSGLNVLYGENDLGKSTLAAAVRAALLVPPNTAEAERFVSWYADAAPTVELTFADDSAQFWRVKKVFHRSARAELLHSKDATHFTLDCKGREVEEKLRGLLSWGIRAPGGKSGSRSPSVSFLANALLAAQTDVDTILRQSLADDNDASGKLRLQKALATLAQDPLFKRVLDAAQTECDAYFTPTGRLSRTQGSKIVVADEEVKAYRSELAGLESQHAQSTGVEELVARLREQHDQLLSAQADADENLRQRREGLANGRLRADGATKVTAAKAALAEIDAFSGQLARAAQDLAELEVTVARSAADFERVRGEAEQASAALRAAEEAFRIATADQGEQVRTVRRAELNAELAKLKGAQTELESRRALAERAQATTSGLQDARSSTTAAALELERLAGETAQARETFEKAEAAVEQGRAVLAYGRWQLLAAKAAEAGAAQQKAEQLRRDAEIKLRGAEDIDVRARSAEATLIELRATLPSDAELELVEQTQNALGLAEAALGGGLDVVIRPRKPIDVRAAVDQRASDHRAGLLEEARFEAERTLQLTIDDLVEIEVRAGATDARRRVEALRTDWKLKCLPILERAGVSTAKALGEAMANARQQAQALKEQHALTESVRAEARSLQERAVVHEKQVTRDAVDPAELASRQTAIGSINQELLAQSWAKLKGNKESEAERLHEEQRTASANARSVVNKLEQHALVATHTHTAAQERVRERERELDRALAAIGDAKPDALLRSISAELERCRDQQASSATALAAIDAEASNARAAAQRALDAAKAAVELTDDKLLAAQRTLDQVRESANHKRGEHAAQVQQLGRMDRAAALASLETCEAELRTLPSAPIATESEFATAEAALEQAQRSLQETREEFHKAEGALSKVGGAQLRERLAQVAEALKSAQAREHEVVVDAHAWKLLRETLRRVEDTESAHLGRALGGPVGERFTTLTRGRYVNFQLDPTLQAQGLQAAGVANETGVLDALSAGTRDQLATLVRLTIANQLRSAIILDDHLVQTDPDRLAWFREMLMRTAVETQVVVFTCRPNDYLSPEELPTSVNPLDLAGGSVRVINLAGLVKRWEGTSAPRG